MHKDNNQSQQMSRRKNREQFRKKRNTLNLQSFIEFLSKERSYAVEYFPFFIVVCVLLILTHIFQSYLLYQFGIELIANHFGQYATHFVTVTLVAIAAFVFYTFHIFWKEVQDANAPFPLANLFGCIILIGVMSYLEYRGGSASVINTIVNPTLTDEQAIKKEYDSQIKIIDKQIAINNVIIKNKQGSYSRNQADNSKLTKQKETIFAERQKQLKRAQEKNDTTESDHKQTTEITAAQMGWIGCGLTSLSFFFCFLISKYISESTNDRLANQEPEQEPTQPKQITVPIITHTTKETPIDPTHNTANTIITGFATTPDTTAPTQTDTHTATQPQNVVAQQVIERHTTVVNTDLSKLKKDARIHWERSHTSTSIEAKNRNLKKYKEEKATIEALKIKVIEDGTQLKFA